MVVLAVTTPTYSTCMISSTLTWVMMSSISHLYVFQVENEYGSFGCNHTYIQHLYDLFHSYLGDDVISMCFRLRMSMVVLAVTTPTSNTYLISSTLTWVMMSSLCVSG